MAEVRVPYQKLRSTPSFDDVNRMLQEGKSPAAIARFLQQERNEYVDVSEDSLARMIRGYRKELFRKEQTPAELVPEEVIKAQVIVEEGIDALETLVTAIRRQLDRVIKFSDLEAELGVPLPGLGTEIERLSRMSKEYVQIAQSLGLEPKIPEQYMVAFARYDGGAQSSAV